MDLVEYLRKYGISENILAIIEHADYPHSDNEQQDYANRIAAQLRACEGRVPFDTLAAAMGDRACCKTGSRLVNSRAIGKMDVSLDEKLKELSGTQYMGKPSITPEGDLLIEAVGEPGNYHRECPCWRLRGCTPENDVMPEGYCMCCAGHFSFHYQKALKCKLKLKQVVSTMLCSQGSKPCVFLYELIQESPTRRTRKVAETKEE